MRRWGSWEVSKSLMRNRRQQKLREGWWQRTRGESAGEKIRWTKTRQECSAHRGFVVAGRTNSEPPIGYTLTELGTDRGNKTLVCALVGRPTRLRGALGSF